MNGFHYPTDLTDEQWSLVEPHVPAPRSGTRRGGRPAVDRRGVVDALLYLVRTGCQWRMLPLEYGPWPTVYHYYRTWKRNGTLEVIHDALRREVRASAGRKPSPSAAIIDSQSVKTTEKGAKEVTTRARRSMGASATSS